MKRFGWILVMLAAVGCPARYCGAAEDKADAAAPKQGAAEDGRRPRATPEELQAALALQQLGARLRADEYGKVLSVEAVGTRFTDAHLTHLRTFSELEALEIGDSKVSDAGLANLSGLVSLQRLYLHGLNNITHAGLKNLEGLTELEVLGLNNTAITGRGLAHLKPLVKLQVLNLSHTSIADADLADLEGLTELNTLALESTKVTGAGLAHLKPLSKLRVLNLSKCRVTDRDLDNLVGLRNLRMLYLRGCPVTPSKVEAFKKKMVGLATYL